MEKLLDCKNSVLLIMPFWNAYDFTDGIFKPRNEEFNKNSVNCWNKMFYARDLRRKLRAKRVTNLIQFKQYSFNLRCGGYSNKFTAAQNPCCCYSIADYRADGLCFVLSENTQTEKDIKDFIEYYSELAERYGLNSFFLKKQEQCIAVFPDHRELTLQGGNALQILFSYLYDLYNGKYSEKYPSGVPVIEIPYIEEEIERNAVKYCGSFCGAMAFYQTRTPVRRSMWHKIYKYCLSIFVFCYLCATLILMFV